MAMETKNEVGTIVLGPDLVSDTHVSFSGPSGGIIVHCDVQCHPEIYQAFEEKRELEVRVRPRKRDQERPLSLALAVVLLDTQETADRETMEERLHTCDLDEPALQRWLHSEISRQRRNLALLERTWADSCKRSSNHAQLDGPPWTIP